MNAPSAPPVRIRPAAAGDLDVLTALEIAGFEGDRMSRRSLRRLLGAPTAATLVAVAGDRIVGYAMLLFRQGSRSARLYSLVRIPEGRGRGIGEALLRAAERVAAEHGATEMRLEVRPDNDRARALYERLGFSTFGRLADYYEDNSDALRMRKSLTGAAPA